MVAVTVVAVFMGVQKKRGFVKASIGRTVCLKNKNVHLESSHCITEHNLDTDIFFSLKNTSGQPYNLALQYEHPVCMTVSLLQQFY